MTEREQIQFDLMKAHAEDLQRQLDKCRRQLASALALSPQLAAPADAADLAFVELSKLGQVTAAGVDHPAFTHNDDRHDIAMQ